MVNPRAITFTAFGQPARVLSVKTLPPLPSAAALRPSQAVIKFIQSPINPSDINVVQGVYPSKPLQHPEGFYIPGNEGLAEIHELSTNSSLGLKVGDWVVMRKPQLGTWASHAMVEFGDILPLPSRAKTILSTAHAATLAVNPPTALRMLSDFVKLKPGDYFIQNAANSAVGRAAIQIAHASGVQSINFVRNRPALQETVDELKSLGATHVCTYDDLEDKQFRSRVKEWTAGVNIQLALNCVGGPVTSRMAGLLGSDAHLVSYGAMSKQPLSLPTSLFIFKNLTCHGYWQSRWYQRASLGQIQEQMQFLVELMCKGALREPNHETVVLGDTDAEAQQQLNSVFQHMEDAENMAKPGLRKLLLSWK